jgi:hypothetical protein
MYKMESKYFCEICGTKPDQLSHHRSHLQTQKHKDNCKIFETDMKIFSISFRHVNHKKWYTTEFKDYIISKYLEETKNDTYTDQDISKWIFQTVLNCGNGKYDWSQDCFDGKPPHICYKNHIKSQLDKIIDMTNFNYNNWGIDRVLKYKETVQTKTKNITHKNDNYYKNMLSRHTNIKFNRLKEIRNGLLDLSYLYKPRDKLKLEYNDIDIYDDNALRYSCLLFHHYGIQSLYPLYNGMACCVDIKKFPQEKKNNSFYFWKEVEVEHSSKIENVNGYGEKRIEKRKIWTSCYMNDIIEYLYYLDNPENINYKDKVPSVTYSYISDDDFKYFIKETLVELFVNKIKYIETHITYIKEEKKYYENELFKIKELNISSELFKSIIHICQYLFEYNDELIEYYKKNMYIYFMNIEKEIVKEMFLKENSSNI